LTQKLASKLEGKNTIKTTTFQPSITTSKQGVRKKEITINHDLARKNNINLQQTKHKTTKE